MPSSATIRPHRFGVIVVGAGHAGAEAALASCRMSVPTLLLTQNTDAICRMSCNPSIGGIGKGHLVREIDALGGAMSLAADRTGIQFRMLNTKKGPSVRATRCQSDKALYSRTMQELIGLQPGLEIAQDEAVELSVENGRVTGVVTQNGFFYRSDAVVLTTGTFLRGLIHIGPDSHPAGRIDEPSSRRLAVSLLSHGLELVRLKTGTPARIRADSIDYSKCARQAGDPEPVFFSYSTSGLTLPQVSCWQTHTTAETRRIVLAGLDRSPLYGPARVIRGTGARYCPSFEDKVVKFPDKTEHHIFLEPEGLATDEVYVNGASNSLPENVQTGMIHSIPGLEEAVILRMAYAIEYDHVPPRQIGMNFETHRVAGLFLAGQINGTSGYEEAAGQGLMAGVNAALSVRKEPPFVLKRSEAYLGVMTDDLVTKSVDEPYRMFTSRAEHRLLLRFDNADLRLMPHARRLGLIDEARFEAMKEKYDLIEKFRVRLSGRRASAGCVQRLNDRGKLDSSRQVSLLQLLKNPLVNFDDLRDETEGFGGLPAESATALEIALKYEGYIRRQEQEIERIRGLEDLEIPGEFDFTAIRHLSFEAKEKLSRIRPATLGQASRIAALRNSDLVLLYHTVKFTAGEKQAAGEAGGGSGGR